MIDVAKIIAEKIDGDAYYYVDDSVIYTNTEKDKFKVIVDSINEELKERIIGNKETESHSQTTDIF